MYIVVLSSLLIMFWVFVAHASLSLWAHASLPLCLSLPFGIASCRFFEYLSVEFFFGAYHLHCFSG